MLKIDILTLFPEMFAPLETSIVKRAQDKQIVEIQITNIRDYALDKHQIADDRPYGGGAGMVMKPEPLLAAIAARRQVEKPRILITSPAGRVYDQAYARELSHEAQIMVVCGHYEGIDQRVIDCCNCELISLGDFVLTGGETAAIAIADSVTRLLPGALGDDASAEEESFTGALLEYPQYTRPAEYQGLSVPAVLQNGNHQLIALWRRQQSLLRTYHYRPELLAQAALTLEDVAFLNRVKQEENKPFRLYTALVHYPVYNKKREIINTSLTNLDLHDIARAAITYGLAGYYLIQPLLNQQQLIDKLLEHWRSGFGARYNPDRQRALALTSVVDTLADAVADIAQKDGESPHVIVTSANPSENNIGYQAMRQEMEKRGGSYLLLLGTGYGLTEPIMEQADYRLRPLYGASEYNHLSVRSAASIMFDRLLGREL